MQYNRKYNKSLVDEERPIRTIHKSTLSRITGDLIPIEQGLQIAHHVGVGSANELDLCYHQETGDALCASLTPSELIMILICDCPFVFVGFSTSVRGLIDTRARHFGTVPRVTHGVNCETCAQVSTPAEPWHNDM